MEVKTRIPASAQELNTIDAYWRAANYLSACQLYLLDDPLLEKPLTKECIKKKIVGHWGTVPGQNFVYTHLNRVIKKYDLDMIYLSGPGHGGNAMVAQDWLDGSYQDVYPNISRDKEGMQRLFKQFSFPGGIPSHVAPETPGSINEGGELGYSLAHAFGAVTDNPGRRRDLSPPHGSSTNSSTLRRTGLCSPFSTSTATRSPTPPSSPASPTRS